MKLYILLTLSFFLFSCDEETIRLPSVKKNLDQEIKENASETDFDRKEVVVKTNPEKIVQKPEKKLKKQELKKYQNIQQARYYKVRWMGLHVGDFVAGISSTESGNCKIEIYGNAKGVANVVSKYKISATSEVKCNNVITPYKFSYQKRMRKKIRNIELNFSDDGKNIKSESNVPAEHPGKRPPVSDDLKNNVFDPLSLGLSVHQNLSQGKKSAEIKLYEGRRISTISYKVLKAKKGQAIEIVQKFIAGQTKREKEKSAKGAEIITIYLDESMWPTKAIGRSPLGTAVMSLKAICDSFEECITRMGDS